MEVEERLGLMVLAIVFLITGIGGLYHFPKIIGFSLLFAIPGILLFVVIIFDKEKQDGEK